MARLIRRRRWRWWGIIEKPEHVTTQWFKDEGDAIILLGNIVDGSDALQGLGGSRGCGLCQGLKSGHAAAMRPREGKELHGALRSLIYAGGIKSAHDCSEGGLAVALAECCISQQVARETPRLIGAQIDLTGFANIRADALLFGEGANARCDFHDRARRGEGNGAERRFSASMQRGWARLAARR
jgi:phosphoribosylformylglycinamidine synthase